MVPAAARRVGSPGRPRHRPRHPDRGAGGPVRRRPGGPAPLGTAAARVVRRRAGVDARPRPRRRDQRCRQHPRAALRVPANRSTHLRPAGDVGGVRQPHPRGRPGPVARARRRPPARRPDRLRRAGPARARQRARRRARRHGRGGDDRGGRARHGAGAGRRDPGPTGGAVPRLRSGRGVAVRVRRCDVRGVRGLGDVRAGARRGPPERRLVGARRAASRLVRDVLLRAAAPHAAGRGRAGRGAVLATVGAGRGRGLRRRAGVRAVRLLVVGGAARAAGALLGRGRAQPSGGVLDVGQPGCPRLQCRPARLRRRGARVDATRRAGRARRPLAGAAARWRWCSLPTPRR